MMCRHMLVVLLATSVVTDDHLQEAVMERPLTSAKETSLARSLSTGGEMNYSRQSRTMDTELIQRQGPLGRPSMAEMTVNALNPMPYFLGGLRGVRDVLRERFFPWRGMVVDSFTRMMPRRPLLPPIFRGRNPRPGGLAFQGGPIRNGGGFRHGNGGFNHDGGGLSGGGADKNKFSNHIKPLTTDDPSGNHHSASGQIIKDNTEFNTPRPHSIITNAEHSNFLRTENPLNLDNTGTNDFTVSTQRTPASSFGTSISDNSFPNINAIGSLSPHTKNKVISIEIPKEFDNLSVLEVSMKSNGDFVIGPKNSTNFASSSVSPGSSHDFSENFSPSLSPFTSSVNEHNFIHHSTPEPNFIHHSNPEPNFVHHSNPAPNFIHHSNPEPRVTNPTNVHVSVPTNSNSNKGSIACMKALSNGQVNSIQDVLCRQKLIKNKNIGGNSISSFGSHHQSFPLNNGIPSSFGRQNPVPQFSANYLQDKQNVNHIYFVPLSVPSPQSSTVPHFQNARTPLREQVNSHNFIETKNSDSNDPNVFYIDITIPGSDHAEPSVRHRTKRSLQFDGWYPLDVSNPMSDEPTLGYQPPPLERVHFSDEPVTDKPMYPVRPKNPTVFVVRAEPKEPELHSVYGTENVEYFHIHPQTNTIRAFRAPDQSVGAIQFVSPPQFGESKENSKVPSGSDSVSISGPTRKFETNTSEKELESTNKDDLFGEAEFFDEASQYNSDYDLDMDGSFSEYSPVIVRPDGYHHRIQPGLRRYRYREVPSRRRFDVVNIPPSSKPENSRSSRPALHELLGNFKYESQIEETPYLGSATDSVRSSIFREVPPPNFLQNQASRRYSNFELYEKNIPRSGPRGPAYRNTGLQEFSSRPWYLIDTKSERRREPSIASYIHPETRLGDERIHYKPFGPISYVSKGSERSRQRDSIYNPHLDDHMNSYKPSTSLIANSLSELLQIFKYTEVTDRPGKGVTEEPITLVREFRYTRPTEEPPTTVSSFDKNLRSDNKHTSIHSGVDTNASRENATTAPQRIPFDAVADTNSLDGYLFSDSEASPEYAHPEVKPNIVIIEGKDIGNSKGLIKQETRLNVVAPSNITTNEEINTTKNEKQAFDELEIIYPGPAPKPTTSRSSSTSSLWPLYIVHEGHSKVKVFGINTTRDKNTATKNIEVVHLTEEPTTLFTETYSPETTTSNPFTSTTHIITTTHTFIDSNSTFLPHANSETISTSSTQELNNNVKPKRNNDYEYYYYDEELGPEVSFGGDYISDGWEHTPLELSGSLHSTAHEFSPPVPSQRSLEGGDLVIPQSSDTFSHVFQERLPRRGDAVAPSRDSIPLLSSVALTRDQLSVARPVFFTKRQQKSSVTDKDASVSQPFEYLSHLRQLSREERSLAFQTENKQVEEVNMSFDGKSLA